MIRPTAVSVKPLTSYKISVTFDNGEQKTFDVAPYIKGEWYGCLKDMAYFNRVTTDGFTVAWPDGQDICPDELYQGSV